jgi:hypothetical protein
MKNIPKNNKFYNFYDAYVNKVKKKEKTQTSNIVIKKKVVTKDNTPKKINLNITVKNIMKKDSPYERGFYGWQSLKSYSLDSLRKNWMGEEEKANINLKITDNVGGCGVQQIYNWGNFADDPKIENCLVYLLNDLHYGTGIILCQVGSKYYDSFFVKCLEQHGFKYHEEYHNYYHGNGDRGRIYTKLIIK